MNPTFIKKIIGNVVALSFFLPSLTWAQDKIDLQDLALPTEVSNLGKSPGAVYYSTTSKNKALMPVHVWGEVSRAGLHYIPLDTTLVKGLSFAGGGSSFAKLDNVMVNRVEDGKVKRYEFNLTQGGNASSHEYVLKPGDTIFIERDRYYEDRTYYTSLIAVAVSVLSGILLYMRIDNMSTDNN